ncbi:hypothetical protein BHC43_02530 [Snodgrassella alvi]|nr:hypothetical protein BHC43_02530 [Snodgrassella alvi]
MATIKKRYTNRHHLAIDINHKVLAMKGSFFFIKEKTSFLYFTVILKITMQAKIYINTTIQTQLES